MKCPICKAEVDYTPMTRNVDDWKLHSCVDFDHKTGERKPSQAPAVEITTTEGNNQNE